jgi:hypothetical protein
VACESNAEEQIAGGAVADTRLTPAGEAKPLPFADVLGDADLVLLCARDLT